VRGNSLSFAHPVGALQAGRRIAVSGSRLRAKVLKPVTLSVVAENGTATEILTAGEKLDLTAFPEPQDLGAVVYSVLRNGLAGTLPAKPDGVVRADENGVELATIAAVLDEESVTLKDPLLWSYDPASVTVNANVVEATHGESVKEMFEGGDATQVFQRFPL